MPHPHDGGGGLSSIASGSTGSVSSGGLAERFKQNPLGVVGTALMSFIEGSQGKPISAVGREADRGKAEFERRRLAVLEGGLEERKRSAAVKEEAASTAAKSAAKFKELEILVRGLQLPSKARSVFAKKMQTSEGMEGIGNLLQATLDSEEAEADMLALARTLTVDASEDEVQSMVDVAVESDNPDETLVTLLKEFRAKQGKPLSGLGKLVADHKAGRINDKQLQLGLDAVDGGPVEGTLVGADGKVKAAVSNAIRNAVNETVFDSIMNPDGTFRILDPLDRPQAQAVATLAENLIQQDKATGVQDAVKKAAKAFDIPIPDVKLPKSTDVAKKASAAQEKLLKQARDAIAKGADVEAVKKRLQEQGADPSKL